MYNLLCTIFWLHSANNVCKLVAHFIRLDELEESQDIERDFDKKSQENFSSECFWSSSTKIGQLNCV